MQKVISNTYEYGSDTVSLRADPSSLSVCAHLSGRGCCLQGQSLIRVLRIAPADFSPPQSWTGYSTSLATATESLAMATVALSKEVLQRPQACPTQ